MVAYLLMEGYSCTVTSSLYFLHLTRTFLVTSAYKDKMAVIKQGVDFTNTCDGIIVVVFTLASSSYFYAFTRLATGFDGCTTSVEHFILIYGT